ncbi:LysR family transcriptional regulator [Altererythrobacter xixiisoli]|uniref:LysR family transcriptional regulator n=2 Tax=Croceibacterium xixiisoli TaxID=1476466 RepID=A0A6I4TV18_9SPHN|nr:LysR family transcriptional regulator [Croceibacterium xixiisoli]
MDLVVAIRSFLRVAETGSFSAAALDLGLTQSSVSRQIAGLEDHYAIRLFHRTTSGLSLTADGERTLPVALQVLEAVESLGETVGNPGSPVRGRVRLSVPTPLGLYLSDRISALLDQNPLLDIELLLRDHPSDLIEDGIDLEIRLGPAVDSSLVSRRIGWTTAYLVASPAYLARRPGPDTPAALSNHDCICYDRGGRGSRWTFSDGSRDHVVELRPRLRSDNAVAVYRAALAGAGVTLLSHILAEPAIAAGQLVPLMPGYPPARLPIVAVYPSRRNMAPRVRAVLDFLIDAIARDKAMRAER